MPHSILQNSTSESQGLRFQDERNKETALYHARLLQHRKDMEALILASTEALLDLPTSPAADPAHPCVSDASIVKSSLKPFQVSDYDSLIEERNINHQCGYVLCPQKNRKQETKAKFRILQDRSRATTDLKFVPVQSLEKWCSDDCGKRALYIKVQLSEEPSWTRSGQFDNDITLLEENGPGETHSKSETDLVQDLLNLDMRDGEEQLVGRMKQLAIDRGDVRSSDRLRGLGNLEVRENPQITSNIKNQYSGTVGKPGNIEGHVPSAWSHQTRGAAEADAEEDVMRTI